MCVNNLFSRVTLCFTYEKCNLHNKYLNKERLQKFGVCIKKGLDVGFKADCLTRDLGFWVEYLPWGSF